MYRESTSGEFYKKNGYKVFMKIIFEKDYAFYGLVYHWNEEFLTEAIDAIKGTNVLSQELNWSDHIWPHLKDAIDEACLFMLVYPFWIMIAIVCKILKSFGM